MIPLSFASNGCGYRPVRGPSALYNTPVLLRLDGSVDAAALERALHDVVTRHESLRTVFPEVDGQPHQRILDATEIGRLLRRRDCADLAELGRRVREVSASVFDLAVDIPSGRGSSRGPTGRTPWFSSCTTSPATAGPSPLAARPRPAYAARARGAAPDWAPLPVQYADYTLWQRDLLGAAGDGDSLLERQLVTGARRWQACRRTGAAQDRPRDVVPSHRGARDGVRPRAEAALGPARLAAEHRVSMFMLMQAAVATLYTRLGAGDDLPLGTVVAGRGEERWRTGRVLREHAGAAHGHLGRSDLRRTAAPGAEGGSGGVLAPGAPVRQPGGAHEPARVPGRHPFVQTVITFNGMQAVPDHLGDLPCHWNSPN